MAFLGGEGHREMIMIMFYFFLELYFLFPFLFHMGMGSWFNGKLWFFFHFEMCIRVHDLCFTLYVLNTPILWVNELNVSMYYVCILRMNSISSILVF